MIAPPKPPPSEELEALIKEARARQLRRRLLAAAGIAIAAALGLSVYAFLMGGSVGGVTPASAGRASGPPCSAAQLSATAGWQGATQSMLGGATITNTSGAACSLPGGRPAAHISWQGRTLSIQERRPPKPFGPGRPLRVLEPGASTVVYLQWWNYCGARVDLKLPPTVSLRFRDGLTVTATASRQWGVPICNSPDGPSTLFVSGTRSAD
jgi:hypothetical protein